MDNVLESQAGTLLNTLPDLFFGFSEDGTIELWNAAVPEVTGYSETELAQMTPIDFFDAEDADCVSKAITELFEKGAVTVEAELVTADDMSIPYEFKACQISTDSSLSYVGIGHDITARRDAEQKQRSILDRMRDGFFAVDADWRITYINERGKHVLGRAMGSDPDTTTFEGMHLWNEIPDAVETTFYEKYHHAMATGESVAFEEYFAPLDEWFDIRAFPDTTGLSVYFRKITDEKQYREELEHREQVLKDLYTITADRDAKFSDQVSQLLMLGRQEFDTEYGSLSAISGDEYRFEIVAADDDSIQAGDVVPVEATNCELVATQRETIAWGDITRDAPKETDRAGYTEWGISCYLGAPVYDNDGVYGTFCFYGTDTRADQFSSWEVTLVDLMSRWVSYELQRKQVTKRLQQKNKRLEEFANIVSHDLRNPLGIVMGRLELAQETGDPAEFARCFDALERMEALIDDILTLSKAGKAIDDLEQVALAELAERAWSSISAENATLELSGHVTVPADVSRLQQLMENLFRNAIEHGGEDVSVTVGVLSDGFYVEDDGVGISESDRDSVFDSGYSTESAGTGFGLAIVADIVEAHGWKISIEDGDAGGVRFEITGIDGH